MLLVWNNYRQSALKSKFICNMLFMFFSTPHVFLSNRDNLKGLFFLSEAIKEL